METLGPDGESHNYSHQDCVHLVQERDVEYNLFEDTFGRQFLKIVSACPIHRDPQGVEFNIIAQDFKHFENIYQTLTKPAPAKEGPKARNRGSNQGSKGKNKAR